MSRLVSIKKKGLIVKLFIVNTRINLFIDVAASLRVMGCSPPVPGINFLMLTHGTSWSSYCTYHRIIRTVCNHVINHVLGQEELRRF